LRIRRRNLYNLFTVISLGIDRHLRARLEIPYLLRLHTFALNRVHYAFLIGLKCLAQLFRPFQLLAHAVDYLRERCEILRTCTKSLCLCCCWCCIRLDVLVLDKPISKIENFLRINRREQQLPE
jgi:hypothetical protein